MTESYMIAAQNEFPRNFQVYGPIKVQLPVRPWADNRFTLSVGPRPFTCMVSFEFNHDAKLRVRA